MATALCGKAFWQLSFILLGFDIIFAVNTNTIHPLLQDVRADHKDVNSTNAISTKVNRTDENTNDGVSFCVQKKTMIHAGFYSTCPRGNEPWIAIGRDQELVRILAAHTNQLAGCIEFADNTIGWVQQKLKENCQIFGTSIYWSLPKINYLYPHAKERLCLMVKRSDFLDRSIFEAFEAPVFAAVGVSLLIFIVTFRFMYHLSTTQSAFEIAETFVTGMFSIRRRRLMIWITFFNIIIINSFNGVFTSFLAIPKRGHEIDTLEEVVQHFKNVYVPWDYHYFVENEIFKRENRKFFAKISPIRRLTTHSSILETDTAYEMLRRGIRYRAYWYTGEIRFMYHLSATKSVFEIAETFVTGMFSMRRRRFMIWVTFFNIIIINSFTGVFTSFLAIPKRGYEIDTLEEVGQHFDNIFVPTEIYISLAKESLKTGNSKLFSKFSTKFRLTTHSAVLETGTAFEMLRRGIKYRSRRFFGEIRQVKECVWTSLYVSFPVRKGWKLAERYNTLLQRLVQGGVLEKVSADGWRNYSSYLKKRNLARSSPEIPSFIPLSLRHFREAFLILGSGLAIATVCAVAEFVRSLKKLQLLLKFRKFIHRCRRNKDNCCLRNLLHIHSSMKNVFRKK